MKYMYIIFSNKNLATKIFKDNRLCSSHLKSLPLKTQVNLIVFVIVFLDQGCLAKNVFLKK